MKQEVVDQLVDLNRNFYDQFAAYFSETRASPWWGFAELARRLPQPCERLLDVGCGDGRLGRYLVEAGRIERYVGVDYSEGLLGIGRSQSPTSFQFHQRNLLDPETLADLGQSDAVASLAVLHHIPGEQNRVRLLRQMGKRLRENGRLIITTFQFMNAERLRRKVLAWERAGLTDADVEATDYLLDWKRGGTGMRYIALIDEAAVARLADLAGLTILDQFLMDGKQNNLNLYTVLERGK